MWNGYVTCDKAWCFQNSYKNNFPYSLCDYKILFNEDQDKIIFLI